MQPLPKLRVTPANETALQNESTQANETTANATQASSGPNLNCIWSFSGIEIGPVTMALNLEGSELYGQAKYEPESGKAWNAEVVGSVTGNKVGSLP